MQYIEHQSNYKNTYVGKYPMSYNGCGVIAIWNLLIYSCNNNAQYFRYVVDYFHNEVYFGGKFGIMPWQMSKYLKVNKVKFKCKIIKIEKLYDFLYKNKGNVFIVMYAEKETGHYIFIDNELCPHNTYGKTLNTIISESPIKYCIVFNITFK